ncbi:nuclear transport factor 2 family protein [Pseudooceanicola nanhaiensis]|uniref:nuclear transport factor 2 family protein n=1 Tax=Pseudooceanicola nanhaiensis TaxID=375761 RepID=UPI001CD707EB|nr:nuclear transport factor 2 family protein [Pseudooceanicola nanhaiensis]MCA0921283.1 nuclear transport factor 2 family protein [Pseudooceanicola nanhaiensis]
MDKAATVDAFYAAYNSHDAGAAAALYASGGRHVEAASGKAREGRDALEAGLVGFFGMLDGLRFDEVKRIHSGNNVLVDYVMRGTMTRDLGPMKAKGQEIALPGVHVFTFEGDEIASTTDYWDPSEFGRQVAA